MAEIVNLRMARKAKKREVATEAAEVNRVAFGRTKTEKTIGTVEAARRNRDLDGAKRDN